MISGRRKHIAIIGTVGLPANYGGFETLCSNLVHHAETEGLPYDISVYCSSRSYSHRPDQYHGASLRYIALPANGLGSVLYDAVSMLDAIRRGADVLLILGVSGALALPVVRLFGRRRIIVNVDGLEWKRAKWNHLARWFLRFSEKVAAKWADVVVADNQAIVDHINVEYARRAELIAYGGDHAGNGEGSELSAALSQRLPAEYALMLCRIEPENNVEMILEAFARPSRLPLVAVGNWNGSEFGRGMRAKFGIMPSITMLDPIFEQGALFHLRTRAALYVHGHSAGGTNPSLVEMMWLARPVLAYDCVYNRNTTSNKARFFKDINDLERQVSNYSKSDISSVGARMSMIARRRYTWSSIGKQYFDLI